MSNVAFPDIEAYASALRSYLSHGGEGSLQTAFRLGREVIQQGKGVIDLVEVHADALRSVLPDVMKERGCAAASGDSCRFLAESLSSFEMMLRGAREVNDALQTVNDTLETRVEQRARELQVERERFQAVIEHNPAALYALRLAPTVEFVYVSPQVEQLFGYSLAEWTPTLVNDIIHEEDRAEVHAAVERAMVAGGQVTAKYRVTARDGRQLHIHDRGHILKSPNGEVVLHGVITDATEQEQLQQQLFHAQKMEAIGRLAGGVAHDFNNLLTVILSFARLVMDDFADSDPRADDVREILRAADSASALTNQLLAFSRRQVVEPRIVDPAESLAQLEKMVRRTLNDDVALVTRYEPGVGRVRVDPGQLDQVVLNLVVNARDAMPEGGTLRLGLRNVTISASDEELADGRYLELSVADTGVGMPKDVAERIFEPFFTTKGAHGTGLGLSTCFGIVRQAGGSIRVDSELGRGTCMRVLLPCVDEAPERPSGEEETPIGGSGHILIVEDQAAILRVLSRVLRNAGYRVTTAVHAEEALDVLARGERIDVLITDLALPGMSGLTLVERARETRPALPVLITTGYSQLEDSENAALLRELPILVKPFRPSQLLTRVYELVSADDEEDDG